MLFAPGCYLCAFEALVLYAGDPSLGFTPQISQVDPTSCLIIPLALLPVGAQPALLSLHRTLYQTGCAKAEASLLLLFTCLFWVISPQFSCNSRLLLGGG